MNSISNLWGREPALILGLIQAAISLAVVFGLDLPEGAEAGILTLSTAVLAVIVRSQVTPTSKG